MNKIWIISVMILLVAFACSKEQGEEENALGSGDYIYWVNSLKAECEGVGPMKCLYIQKGDSVKDDQWHLFYDQINGFDYEEGYVYKIVVHEEDLPTDAVSADGSSIKYTMVRVLEKVLDQKLALNDIWGLEQIEGATIELAKGQKRPSMEINLKQMQVLGNDGCNNYSGRISAAGGSNISFGPIMATRMMCENMEITNQFNQLFNQVKGYQLAGGQLYLKNEDGKAILTFKKVD